MDFGLKDKRAFVGGGGRGIGKAIALELAREGADVVIASRTISELEKSAKEIEDITGRKVIPMALDVTKAVLAVFMACSVKKNDDRSPVEYSSAQVTFRPSTPGCRSPRSELKTAKSGVPSRSVSRSNQYMPGKLAWVCRSQVLTAKTMT